MVPRLVIFSGLPGTGKSVLADRLARELSWPLLRIDDVAECLADASGRGTTGFWDRAIRALLVLVRAQLALGVNVIADSLFINTDRFEARAIARETGAHFLPVHTFVSDEAVWKERVERRFNASSPAEGVASWDLIQYQRRAFRPWERGQALLLDAVRPVGENYETLLAFVRSETPRLEPLPEVPFQSGHYHG